MYYRIKNDKSEWDMTGNFEINQAQKEWLSDKARLLLSSLVNPPKPPITIDQLRLKLAELIKRVCLNIKSENDCRNIWNTHTNKGSSRPNKVTSKKYSVCKKIYWWKMLQEVMKHKYILNIDECGFCYNLKN